MGPEESRSQPDFTKTRTYAVLDLFFKGLSAAAIVVIGVATYLLQNHVEATHEHDVAIQRDQRRYIPFLRSAAEVDDLLVTISGHYAFPKYDEKEMRQKDELGARLDYLASSMRFPDGYEPMIALPVAREILSDHSDPECILVRSRSAMELLSDYLRYSPMIGIYAQLQDGTVTLEQDHL